MAGELERVRSPPVVRRHIQGCLAGSFQKRLYLIHQRSRMNAWRRILYERGGSSILVREDTDVRFENVILTMNRSQGFLMHI